MTRKLLGLAGIGEERLHLAWVSSAEAQRFVDVATQVTASVRAQGKFNPSDHQMALEAAELTLNGEIVRWLVGKEVKITTQGDVYGRKWDAASLEPVMDSVLEREYYKNLILTAVKGGCPNPREISARIGLELRRVSYLLADLEKMSMVEFRGMEDAKPVFAAL